MNKYMKDEAQGGSQQCMSVLMLPGVKSVQNDPLEGYIYRQLTRIEPLEKSCQKTA